MKQAMINYIQKEKFDNLYTPIEAVKLLYKYIPLLSRGIIWECCNAGRSTIVDILFPTYTMISTDILSGFNFLTDTPNFKFDAIITNPPYSLKDQFIEKCIEYEKPFALLL